MNSIRLAAIAAALASPLLAAAAPRAVPTPRALPPPPASAEARSQRAPSAPAAAPAPPAPREAPPRGALFGGRAAWIGAGFGAVSAFDVGKGIALQVDYAILRTPATWRKLDLEWHLVASFSRPTGDAALTSTVTPPGGGTPIAVDAGTEEVSALLFQVVPTARALWTVTQGIAFFGDAGLGLCQTVEQYDRSEMFRGRSERTEYATGFVARIGLGLAADLNPHWRVVFEPVAFDLQLGPKFSAFTPTLGVAYRL